jgi:hypothetical protein
MHSPSEAKRSYERMRRKRDKEKIRARALEWSRKQSIWFSRFHCSRSELLLRLASYCARQHALFLDALHSHYQHNAQEIALDVYRHRNAVKSEPRKDWYARNKNKVTTYKKKFQQSHPEVFRAGRTKLKAKYRAALNHNYVKELLAKRLNMSRTLIPEELIEAKTLQLYIQRALKEAETDEQ